ncbi:UPF0565 protein C2orf69 homolog [Belonocnema kinseyi]|uniref:UPF0565 protein C2orf69 homolog n=1 Tax=Belonocnema kinseyi TaxID=2817044 RepID=UPI00143D1D5E|nr:UPF0565 protein C2orf69 homolog [Belonocnema kinseyi]
MALKLKTFKNVNGILNRRNDILYGCPQKSSATSRILVFFGGDTQDFRENMAQHKDSTSFRKWSFENTAHIMSEKFPQNHILIIRPARRKVLPKAVINCFDNFVKGSEYGAPTFAPNYSSLLHLKTLLESLAKSVTQISKEILNEGELSLMGFSKGSVVLNQFLHEFHYYQNPQEQNDEIVKFISRIKEMWWLDGGHPGQKDTWITDKAILDSFIKLGIDVHVDVTPYQINDSQRPWIRIEEQTFSETLQKGGANIQRHLHFGDQPRKLEYHFTVLKKINV